LCADWGEERGFDLHNATEKEVEDRVRELSLIGEKMVRARRTLSFTFCSFVSTSWRAPRTAAGKRREERREGALLTLLSLLFFCLCSSPPGLSLQEKSFESIPKDRDLIDESDVRKFDTY
jgi:hypothetical protein